MEKKTEFGCLLEDITPDLGEVCIKLRSVIAKLHPAYIEIVWPKQKIASYGVGPKKMSEHYVYIAPQTKHINLGLYHGASADDPDGILEGTGKKLRHVKIRTLAEAKATPIKRLIAEAIKDRKAACG